MWTLHHSRHLSASTGKVTVSRCAESSVARKAAAASTTAPVETIVLAMGKSPGRTTPSVVMPRKGSDNHPLSLLDEVRQQGRQRRREVPGREWRHPPEPERFVAAHDLRSGDGIG